MKIRELVVLAGGSGTRIREQLPGKPKVLAPIGGKSFIDYLIRYHIVQGVERFVFSLGEYGEQIKEHLEKNHSGINRAYVFEPVPLGTGGAIQNAIKKCNDNTVLVLNGDTYFAIQIETAAAFHHMCGAECTMILKPVNDVSRYGSVELGPDYRLKGFSEKGKNGQGLINGGAYLLNKRLFLENVMPDKFSFEKLYLENSINNKRIFGVTQDVFFIDIGTPEDYTRAQTEIVEYDNRLDKTN